MVLVLRLDCLRTCLRDMFVLLAMQDGLALVYQHCGRCRLKLHTLIQVQVELWKLELAWDSAPSARCCEHLLLDSAVSGNIDTFKHVHGALSQGLIHIDAMLLLRHVCVAASIGHILLRLRLSLHQR